MKDITRYALTLTSAVVLCGTAAAQTPSTPPGARGPAVQVTKALGPGDKLASNLIGATVKSTQGENIGEVTDLIVSDKNAVLAAVVSAGGVLGVGQKKIAVRYQDFEVSPDGRTLYLNMNEEQLESQPPFDNSVTSTAATRTRPAEPQPGTAPAPAPAAQRASADARPDTTAEHHAANAPASSATTGRTLKSGEQGAKALIGTEVVDKSDARVGKIRDLIVAPGKEDVQAVVALGSGPAFASTKMIAIPLGNLKIVPGKDRASEPDRAQTAMTETQLAALPEFHYE